jgi:endonuclease YncB( thermonuclease family)
MKQRLLPFILSLSLLALAGCGPSASTTASSIAASSTATSTTSSTTASSSAAASSVDSSSAVASSSAEVCDTTDYTANLHPSLDYKGHAFLTDGIGPVTLKENIDGDTTHFYALNSDGTTDKSFTIKCRYLCIDTPESTGSVQKWGHAASLFTSDHINSAKTIVISSDATSYGAPKADSTGTRYLAYIWVSDKANAALSDLTLLNLLIVQNGFSATKSATDTLYADYFYKADAEAQCQKLHIWGTEKDPYFIDTTGTPTTLQQIVLGKKYDVDTETYNAYDWTDISHNKVSFDCYVAMTSGDNAYVYMDYPSLDNEDVTVRYGMYIFTGYKSIAPLTHVGWKLNVVGVCSLYMGSYELASVTYNALYHNEDDITILDKTGSTYTPLVVTPTEASQVQYINVVVTVKNLHGETGYGTYADTDGGSCTVKCLNPDSETISLRFDVGTVTDRVDVTKTITKDNFETYFCTSGETYNVTAPVARYTASSGTTTWQLYIRHNADIAFN